MTILRLFRRRTTAVVAATPTGLQFISNNDSGGDIRLVWSGANFLSRYPHTVVWRARYIPQVGYYAVTWHDWGDGTWHASDYEFGAHPYPCDGTDDVDGQASNGTGSSGTVQYMELAGIGAVDHISVPMVTPFLINDPGNGSSPAQAGTWLSQARVAFQSGSDIIHRVWPNTDADNYIEMSTPVSGFPAPSTPQFYFGASAWTATGSTNEECPSAVLRGLRLFSAQLSIADIQAEVAAIGNNVAASSTGLANTWYINDNPTPSDITDKSAAGHTPSWANSNRPTLWTG